MLENSRTALDINFSQATKCTETIKTHKISISGLDLLLWFWQILNKEVTALELHSCMFGTVRGARRRRVLWDGEGELWGRGPCTEHRRRSGEPLASPGIILSRKGGFWGWGQRGEREEHLWFTER